MLFNLLSGFVLGFALMRLSTAGIRGGWWPFGNVRLGGRHIHHFVPGILIAFGSGAVALVTDNARLEQALAVPFGAGIGLTFDEAALLLDLRDVYWTREGVLSVQLSCGLAATLGGTILALRMLRRGEERVEAAGLIPPPEARRIAGACGAPGRSAHGAVAGEELAVLLEEPGELEGSLELRQALRQARPLAAGELRRVGDEQLVDQARLDQLGVHARARPRRAARGRRARFAGGVSAAARSTRPWWRTTRTGRLGLGRPRSRMR